MIKIIEGGVCAAKGYTAGGIYCGIRKRNDKNDLALIFSKVPAHAAAVYTTNLVKGAPLTVTKQHIADGIAQAVICNSGNANTCNSDGLEIAEKMSALAAEQLGIGPRDVIVASTGVIGQKLNITPVADHIGELAAALSPEGEDEAAKAIMTTDLVMKKIAVEFEIDGKVCRLGGIAKGSGMIHPNMATMLVFLTTDAAISAPMLQKALSHDVQKTFNMLSVDGDTSTNDMVTIMANGLAGNTEIAEEGPAFDTFMKALNTVTISLCRTIAGDGEGATKLLECDVTGAADEKTAAYSGADLDVNKVDVAFKSAKGILPVCKNGAGVDFSEEFAKEVLLEKEITILVNLNSGSAGATAWGCDLTYDYVKINGDYRS